MQSLWVNIIKFYIYFTILVTAIGILSPWDAFHVQARNLDLFITATQPSPPPLLKNNLLGILSHRHYWHMGSVAREFSCTLCIWRKWYMLSWAENKNWGDSECTSEPKITTNFPDGSCHLYIYSVFHLWVMRWVYIPMVYLCVQNFFGYTIFARGNAYVILDWIARYFPNDQPERVDTAYHLTNLGGRVSLGGWGAVWHTLVQRIWSITIGQARN